MRYQKIESKIWNDEKFINLTPNQQRLFFYILTCPHGNLIGIFVLKSGYICEDLKCLAKDLAKDLAKLCENDLIYFDHRSQVILIKNFLKHNPITNPNQRQAALKIITDLPKTPLLNKFLVLNKELSKGLPEALKEVLLKPETETETETEEKNIRAFQPDALIEKTSKKKKLNSGFETFWSVYPKKKGKGQAEKAWIKAQKLPDFDLQSTIQAVENQKKSDDWIKEGGQFIPFPSTWLNQKRWLDEIDTHIKKDPWSAMTEWGKS